MRWRGVGRDGPGLTGSMLRKRSGGPTTISITDATVEELARLTELHAAGVLTDAELETNKTRLLGG